MARQRYEEFCQQGKVVSRGEVWMMTQRKIDGSYIHEDAKAICVLEKEHPGRVRGMGFGPNPSLRRFWKNYRQS
ncbi:hypothetical protein PIB30_087781 [Stylosanthes scabra]|uniref:Uncharacterized protein n=1 Tax=Stylosanthes scabra TaxID=79078 RepID=A0ABU6SUD3_9FABA|nr:hypothetical protein [Stylosanthes scabra]